MRSGGHFVNTLTREQGVGAGDRRKQLTKWLLEILRVTPITPPAVCAAGAGKVSTCNLLSLLYIHWRKVYG